jgi:hypothetical protein
MILANPLNMQDTPDPLQQAETCLRGAFRTIDYRTCTHLLTKVKVRRHASHSSLIGTCLQSHSCICSVRPARSEKRFSVMILFQLIQAY